MTTVDRLQSINTRVSDLDGDIAEFNRQREELAVRYSQNDKTAIKQVAQLDASSEAAVKERSLLVSAMEQLTKLAESEQQAVLDKVERERQIKAANLAKTICDTNSAIDAKLQELRNLLELRADNLNQLKMLGVTDAMYLNKMRDLPNGAFAAAGLGKFVNLHTPSPQAIRPLGASNGFFNSIGKKLKADVE